MNDYRFGFRVAGDCRQPRRLVDWQRAFAAHLADDDAAENDKEQLLSQYVFNAKLREHLEHTGGSVAGLAGCCGAAWLTLDIDADGNLPAAFEHARRLAVLLVDNCETEPEHLLIFFSGSKGCHLSLPTALWQPAPGPHFHRVARLFAEQLARAAEATIDAGVFDRVRLIRAPNSTHPRTGLRKRPLTFDELLHLSADAIVGMAAEPRAIELPKPTYRSSQLADAWAQAAEAVAAERAATATAGGQRRTGPLNRSTLAFIRDGAATGDRHRLLYSSAANLGERGAPLELAAALLEDSALDSGLPPADVQRAIRNGWHSSQPGLREVCERFRGEVVDVRPAVGADA